MVILRTANLTSASRLWATALLFTLLGVSQVRADTVQIGTIDFRQGANLKMIFDGGLRPYRLQGLESNTCVFDKAVVTVIFPDTAPVTFQAQSASMDLLAGNEIYGLDLFGEYMEVPQAVALAKAICSSWHQPSAELDAVAANLGTMPGDSEGWGASLNKPEFSAHFTFKPTYLALR
jgi:hypothetical protein